MHQHGLQHARPCSKHCSNVLSGWLTQPQASFSLSLSHQTNNVHTHKYKKYIHKSKTLSDTDYTESGEGQEGGEGG